MHTKNPIRKEHELLLECEKWEEKFNVWQHSKVNQKHYTYLGRKRRRKKERITTFWINWDEMKQRESSFFFFVKKSRNFTVSNSDLARQHCGWCLRKKIFFFLSSKLIRTHTNKLIRFNLKLPKSKIHDGTNWMTVANKNKIYCCIYGFEIHLICVTLFISDHQLSIVSIRNCWEFSIIFFSHTRE